MTAADESLSKAVQMASDAFEETCQKRHEMGAEQYGPTGFMRVDTLRMAMEEVADLANYARYTYIKLWLLQDELMSTEEEQVGPHAFTPLKEQ